MEYLHETLQLLFRGVIILPSFNDKGWFAHIPVGLQWIDTTSAFTGSVFGGTEYMASMESA